MALDTRSPGTEELLGRWFWIQRLEQESTGRCFYPDLLYKLDFPEAKLLTGDKVLGRTSMGDVEILEEKLLLYDMESTAVFQAANFYLAPEDFFFLRCVTDFGVNPGEETDSFSSSSLSWKEKLQSLLQKEEEKILRLIRFLQEKSKERRKEEEAEAAFRQQLQSLSESLHCSFVMEKQLERLLRYAFLQGISAEEVREYLERNFGGKSSDKRAGKKALSSLKEWILSERILTVECDGSGDSLQINRGSSEKVLMNHYGSFGSTSPEGRHANSYPYQGHFRHIYVEEALLQSPEAEGILRKFPKAKVIPIKHYKDVFNRKKQGRLAQSRSR